MCRLLEGCVVEVRLGCRGGGSRWRLCWGLVDFDIDGVLNVLWYGVAYRRKWS